MVINKVNLAKMIEYMKTINEDKLSMKDYSNRNAKTAEELLTPLNECNSSGCIIGHCVHLDTQENIREFTEPMAMFSYYLWSHSFVFEEGCNAHKAWNFMFGENWGNNLKEAIARMNYMLEVGTAPEWFDEYTEESYEVSMIERYGNKFLKESK